MNHSARFPAMLLLLVAVACSGPSEEKDTLALQRVKAWVSGSFNNVAQAEADLASDLQPEQMHRPMHQLFVPVEVPGLEGYIVYQQSSLDGSENPAMIFRHGLMQYLEEPASGKLRQRELYFKDDADAFKNAHRNPDILRDVTPDDLTWDEGCDFHLSANAEGTMVSGPIREGACVMFNKGLNKNMYADDLVEITATEYRFRGRYVDSEGNVLWGTESDVLNTLVRQD